MANLLSGLAKIVGGATKSIRYPITLTKAAVTKTTDKPWEGKTSTKTAHACEGLVLDYKDWQIDLTSIQRGDRKVMIMAATLAAGIVPMAGDTITAQGTTYNVIQVARDPASATYECQVRTA